MNKYQRRIDMIRNRLPGLNKDQLRKLAEDDNYRKFRSATRIGKEVIERIVKRDILKEGGENEN